VTGDRRQEKATARARLLLHCCCGPCATAVIERLREGHDLRLYWFNPNIQPEDELSRRLEAMRALAEAAGLPLHVEEGGEEQWERAVVGLEDEPEGGARCDACYRIRLEHAAAKARELSCEAVAATLSISPHKDAERINRAGAAAVASAPTGGPPLRFLAEDFSAVGGFARSVELAKRFGLYRQRYCGCRFSLPPRG
jgi:predicted adenine nucleotide alpha hydrolase (AANH) superfamily ATPase